jgi:hypothetical protein
VRDFDFEAVGGYGGGTLGGAGGGPGPTGTGPFGRGFDIVVVVDGVVAIFGGF